MNPIQDRVASWAVDLAYLDLTTQLYTLGSLVLQGVGAVWTLVNVFKGVWNTGGTILAKVRARKDRRVRLEGVRLRRMIREVVGEFMPEGEEVEVCLDSSEVHINPKSLPTFPQESSQDWKKGTHLRNESENSKKTHLPGPEFGEVNSKPE